MLGGFATVCKQRSELSEDVHLFYWCILYLYVASAVLCCHDFCPIDVNYMPKLFTYTI